MASLVHQRAKQSFNTPHKGSSFVLRVLLESSLASYIMASKQTDRFSGPDFNIKPTAVDQRSSKIYLKQVLILPLPQPQEHEKISEILREAMQATVKEIPCLAAQVVTKENGQRALDPGSAQLVIKDLTKDIKFADLKAANFAQELLDPNVLLPIEQFYFVDSPLDVFKVQANFIQGGLLLSIAVHHFATDASGVSTVVRALASQCRRAQFPQNVIDGLSEKIESFKLSPRKFDRSPFYNWTQPGDISALKAYSLLDKAPPKPAWMTEKEGPVSSETFRLSPLAIKSLKDAASNVRHPDQFTNGDAAVTLEPYITTHDAVCGLLWRTIIISRHKNAIVSLNESSNFKMPVDFRHLLDPPLAPDYIGNAFMQMSATLPVSTLIGTNGLTFAAHSIRRGVSEINKETARIYVKIIGQAPDPRNMSANIDDITGPQLLLTSWRKFSDVALDFGEKLGTYEAFRLPHKGLTNGCPVVLPTLPDGSWEVALTLDREIMEGLKGDETWAKYTTME